MAEEKQNQEVQDSQNTETQTVAPSAQQQDPEKFLQEFNWHNYVPFLAN